LGFIIPYIFRIANQENVSSANVSLSKGFRNFRFSGK